MEPPKDHPEELSGDLESAQDNIYRELYNELKAEKARNEQVQRKIQRLEKKLKAISEAMHRQKDSLCLNIKQAILEKQEVVSQIQELDRLTQIQENYIKDTQKLIEELKTEERNHPEQEYLHKIHSLELDNAGMYKRIGENEDEIIHLKKCVQELEKQKMLRAEEELIRVEAETTLRFQLGSTDEQPVTKTKKHHRPRFSCRFSRRGVPTVEIPLEFTNRGRFWGLNSCLKPNQ